MNNENKDEEFSEETIIFFKDFTDILRKIHIRLISEGWVIEGDKFTPPPGWVDPNSQRRIRKKKTD